MEGVRFRGGCCCDLIRDKVLNNETNVARRRRLNYCHPVATATTPDVGWRNGRVPLAVTTVVYRWKSCRIQQLFARD